MSCIRSCEIFVIHVLSWGRVANRTEARHWSCVQFIHACGSTRSISVAQLTWMTKFRNCSPFRESRAQYSGQIRVYHSLFYLLTTSSLSCIWRRRKLLTAADLSCHARVCGRENERQICPRIMSIFGCNRTPRTRYSAAPGRHSLTSACIAVISAFTPHAWNHARRAARANCRTHAERRRLLHWNWNLNWNWKLLEESSSNAAPPVFY